MRYTMYYEENDTIDDEKYDLLKQRLLLEQPKKKFESYTIKKQRFVGGEEGAPDYFLCIKNDDDSQIYMEKKYKQNGIFYKKCEKMTREECEKLLKGDIEWMKNHKKLLFADFYLQSTLNYLSPGPMTIYEREMMKCKREGYVTFCKRIVRAAGSSTDIFTEDYIPISCLPEEKVRVTYKKEITLPNMVLGMLQMGDEPADEFAFAF